MKEYQLYIDGQYTSSASGEYTDNMNPANNEVYSKVQNAKAEDLDAVISSSQKAFETWKDMPPCHTLNNASGSLARISKL